jgi:hypothetical protein
MKTRVLLLKLIIASALVVPNIASAKIQCSNPDIGAMSTSFVSRDAAKSWVPDEISFDTDYVDWYGRRINEASSSTEFYFFAEGRKISGKYSKARKRLLFRLGSDPGIKIHAPAYYRSCTDSKSSNSSQPTGDIEKRAFASESTCKRKYIQTYLKSAGLYYSSIDGKWGNGTKSALHKANKITRFRNMSPDKIIKTLAKEAPC